MIEFTFNNKSQDIKRFVKAPYWGNRLNNSDNVSYKDEIVMVLRSFGGEASLPCIQKEIQTRNRLREIKTDPDWQAGVRFTLQRFSSDSKSFAHGEDLFYTKSFYSGIWGLRETETKRNESYSKEDFLAEINIKAAKYDAVTALLKKRKSIMIKRVPGIGKNIFPECLSFSLMQVKDKNRLLTVRLASFFSSKEVLRRYYSGDDRDFILSETVFMNFCKKALEDAENDYYFIIDDIDRKNLSRILMDLMFLFRRDRRNSGIDKYFTGEIFCIPDNVFVMVILNTEEKSTAFIENILGRRFSMIEIEPAVDSDGAVNYLKSSAEISEKQNEKPKMIRPRTKKETALEVMCGIKKIC